MYVSLVVLYTNVFSLMNLSIIFIIIQLVFSINRRKLISLSLLYIIYQQFYFLVNLCFHLLFIFMYIH